MSTTTEKSVHVYRVYINATPEAIWTAITDPKWTQQYGYRAIAEFSELAPGGSYKAHATPEFQEMGMPETVVDGEVLEVDPPRRLVHTWRFLWDESVMAEGPNKVTYEIEPSPHGVSMLTVIYELENAPQTFAMINGDVPNAGGGWYYVLSDLKSLLETGSPLPG